MLYFAPIFSKYGAVKVWEAEGQTMLAGGEKEDASLLTALAVTLPVAEMVTLNVPPNKLQTPLYVPTMFAGSAAMLNLG